MLTQVFTCIHITPVTTGHIMGHSMNTSIDYNVALLTTILYINIYTKYQYKLWAIYIQMKLSLLLNPPPSCPLICIRLNKYAGPQGSCEEIPMFSYRK